jgi:hypothetical protein
MSFGVGINSQAGNVHSGITLNYKYKPSQAQLYREILSSIITHNNDSCWRTPHEISSIMGIENSG